MEMSEEQKQIERLKQEQDDKQRKENFERRIT